MSDVKSAHTPTPWKISNENCGGGLSITTDRGAQIAYTCESSDFYGFKHNCETVTTDEAKKNGEFIVQACNAHDALVEALRTIATGSAMVNKEKFTHADVVEAYQTLARKVLKLAGAA